MSTYGIKHSVIHKSSICQNLVCRMKLVIGKYTNGWISSVQGEQRSLNHLHVKCLDQVNGGFIKIQEVITVYWRQQEQMSTKIKQNQISSSKLKKSNSLVFCIQVAPSKNANRLQFIPWNSFVINFQTHLAPFSWRISTGLKWTIFILFAFRIR